MFYSQVRVNPGLMYVKRPGTLPGAYADEPPCDPHFTNAELEWLIKSPPGHHVTRERGLVIYGLMLRITDVPTDTLPQCQWWKGFERTSAPAVSDATVRYHYGALKIAH